MLFPIRCFTCMKVIGNKWETYKKYCCKYVAEGSNVPEEKALDELRITRSCCRTRFLTHAELFDKKLQIYEMQRKENIQRISKSMSDCNL